MKSWPIRFPLTGSETLWDSNDQESERFTALMRRKGGEIFIIRPSWRHCYRRFYWGLKTTLPSTNGNAQIVYQDHHQRSCWHHEGRPLLHYHISRTSVTDFLNLTQNLMFALNSSLTIVHSKTCKNGHVVPVLTTRCHVAYWLTKVTTRSSWLIFF